ncbi:hypothetical protein [Geobacillus sp. WSUCF-018B]|uniref:hypothetical protein n=1 Tax=Geobacillus sp. WSUCF-018B TaxID=2055939 RepID=UPI0011AF16CF|nr:hypothetical protein [Geobacillus sp. WSUCF-018B]
MSIQQRYGKDIWEFIVQAVVDHAEFPVESHELTPYTYVTELFSLTSPTGKNRLGNVLFDVFDRVNELCGIDLKIDYPPRSEFHLFPQLKDIWNYFIRRLESEWVSQKIQRSKEKKSAKGIIIPFPEKTDPKKTE